MIRSRNTKIDLADLESQIAEELERDPQARTTERLARLAAAVHVRTIENALERAEERSAPRTAWPADIRLFPIHVSPGLQRLVLRAMGLAFRDQYEVNAELIRAQRETIALVDGLIERVERLEAQLDAERAALRSELMARRNAAD
uniref:Uncharacterized protein n=1 Tax=uncultured organism TaxID=155900 RepID=A0A7L9QCN6_9ZZZZ|nr:hypothetical protein [uncultured organism]